MSSESSGRRRVPRSAWLFGLLWVVVTAAATFWGVPHQEEDLTERAEAAVAGQGITVDFAGRDASLSGEVAESADLDRVIAGVRQLRGVRHIDASAATVRATTVPPADAGAEATPPELTLLIADGVVNISGTVPDQAAADAMLAGAKARWGPDNVVHQLVVGENTSGAAWLAGAVRMMDTIDDLDAGTISIGPSGALLVGSVANAEIRAGIEETITLALGATVPISNQIEVVDYADPSFEAELLDDGSVQLRGVMPSQSTIDAIVAAATATFGSASVINEMTVGPEVASPGYLQSLPALFGVIDGLRPWKFSVNGGQASISGLAVSDGAIDRNMELISATVGSGGLEVENQLEFDPSAVATVLTELLQGTATFQIGSAQLSDEAIGLLDEAIAILADNPATVLTVEGHTDDVGSDEDNLALSEARAQAVVDFLVAGGVDEDRLTAVGFGESRPIADNGSAEGRAENRRIQFVVEEGDN